MSMTTFIRGGVINPAIVSLVLGGLLTGCSLFGPESDERDVGAVTGGAIGAGAGAIIGNQLGSPATGAVLGGGAGAITGAAIGSANQRTKMDKRDQQDLLRTQQEALQRQERELEDVRRQQYYDDKFQVEHAGNQNSGSGYSEQGYGQSKKRRR